MHPDVPLYSGKRFHGARPSGHASWVLTLPTARHRTREAPSLCAATNIKAYTSSTVEVYKRETREVVRRFLTHNLSFPNCIAALDAALAGLLPRLQPDQIDEVRAVILANNDQVMEQMATRSQKAQRIAHGAKHLYVDCKECGHRITLQVHTGEAGDPLHENLTCPDCRRESAYSPDDFKTAELF